MWTCRRCETEVEDSFGMCWNCGTAKDGTPDPNFHNEAATEGNRSRVERQGVGQSRLLKCLRCQTPLQFLGRRSFEEGQNQRSGLDPLTMALDVFSTVFRQQEYLDVYCCPRCGKVEIFVDGVGEELRD